MTAKISDGHRKHNSTSTNTNPQTFFAMSTNTNPKSLRQHFHGQTQTTCYEPIKRAKNDFPKPSHHSTFLVLLKGTYRIISKI